MIIRNIDDSAIYRALDMVNARYDGNIKFRDGVRQMNARAFQFTLTVQSSRGAGSRISANYGLGRSERRIAAACWHAYRDYFKALFELAPDAKVRTGHAKYDGRDGFEREFPATGYHNIGSQMFPMSYAEACDCGPFA